jgi:hypothetical protein
MHLASSEDQKKQKKQIGVVPDLFFLVFRFVLPRHSLVRLSLCHVHKAYKCIKLFDFRALLYCNVSTCTGLQVHPVGFQRPLEVNMQSCFPLRQGLACDMHNPAHAHAVTIDKGAASKQNEL